VYEKRAEDYNKNYEMVQRIRQSQKEFKEKQKNQMVGLIVIFD